VAEANDAVTPGKRVREADHAAERSCVVTRALLPPDELIRFVASPSGEIVPDVARKLPGRGVWVTCSRSAVEKAVSGKAFARALKRRVDVPADLADRVEERLLRRALDALSLANKAGLVVTGAGKVNTWIEQGAEGALIQAIDASPEGLAKVARKYRAVSRAGDRSPACVALLTIEQLGLAMGRANVVHAALSDGKAADNFLVATKRLEQYRAISPDRSASENARAVAVG
jgi:hypothetical protein